MDGDPDAGLPVTAAFDDSVASGLAGDAPPAVPVAGHADQVASLLGSPAFEPPLPDPLLFELPLSEPLLLEPPLLGLPVLDATLLLLLEPVLPFELPPLFKVLPLLPPLLEPVLLPGPLLPFKPLLFEPPLLELPLLEPPVLEPSLFDPLLLPVTEGLPPFVTELVTTTSDGVAQAEHQTAVVVYPVGTPVGLLVHPRLHVAVTVITFVVRPVGQTSTIEVTTTVVVGTVILVV